MVYVKFKVPRKLLKRLAGKVITEVIKGWTRVDWYQYHGLTVDMTFELSEPWGATIKATFDNNEVIDVTYVTCCGNEWDFDFETETLSISGSRYSVQRFLKLTESVARDDALYVRVGDNVYEECPVIVYKTSTPKEWDVKWHEVLEIPYEQHDENIAIIMRHGYPRRVVPYKNVYKNS